MRKLTLLLTIGVCLFSATVAMSEVQVSGLADIVFQKKPTSDYSNESFMGYSNFHTLRTRLFVDAGIDEHIAVYTQILFDNGDLSLYGAYVKFSDVLGQNLNAHIGLIPTTVGTFGRRAYSDKNPLIGAPLVYTYHTTLNPIGAGGYGNPNPIPQRTVGDLMAARDDRDDALLPMIYENCWNTGLEVFGAIGALDYSVGLLTGSLTKPSLSQEKETPQLTTRLAYNFSPALVWGANAYYGPYLYESYFADTLPTNTTYNEFASYGLGYDLYFLPHRLIEVYSEAFWANWEHPWLPKLSAVSGYLEGQYAFSPGWHVATRWDMFEPVTVDDGSGTKVEWDYPVQRWEFGVGYKPSRFALLKAVAQLNYVQGSEALDHNLFALQTSISF